MKSPTRARTILALLLLPVLLSAVTYPGVPSGDPFVAGPAGEQPVLNPKAMIRLGGCLTSAAKIGDISSGRISRVESVLLAENPLFFFYSSEGDKVYAWNDGMLRSLDGYLGINAASSHAAWGRFAPGPVPSMMSLNDEGILTLWHRLEEEFLSVRLDIKLPSTTGLATIALPESAGLLAGTPTGMRELLFEDGEWNLREHPAPEAAGRGGPVFAIDLNGDGAPERMQAHENALLLLNAENLTLHSHPPIGIPQRLTVADLNGDGILDILIIGSISSVMHIQTGDLEFEHHPAAGDVELLQEDEEDRSPPGTELRVPASVTGPVPLLLHDGARVIGTRIAAPHAPAWVGQRISGPIDVTWRKGPDHEPHTQRIPILRPEAHLLRGE